MWSGSIYKTASSDFRGFWWPAQLEKRYQGWRNNKIWFCPRATKPITDKNGQATGEFNHFGAWGIFVSNRTTSGGFNIRQALVDAKMPLLYDEEYGIAGSYGINGYCLSASQPDDKNNWKGPNAKGPLNDVPLFLEALRFDGWPEETEKPAISEAAAWSGVEMARYCINRHRGFTDVCFLDSSVRKVGLKELYKLKWHKKFNTNGPLTKAGGVKGTDWPDWIRKYPDY